MNNKERDFFDQLAGTWDETRLMDSVKLSRLVAMIGLAGSDIVLDAGCGTGVLVPFVKAALGEGGQIVAVDFSASMIARAAEKYRDLTGVRFVACDIREYRPDITFDKVVCLNFFPHIADKKQFVAKWRGFLKDGGCLVIMHDIPRTKVNAIHSTSATVQNDRLPAGKDVAEMLTAAGYTVAAAVDNDELYFIKAVK